MLRAIAAAENGRLSTPPNPWVGCVLVKNGKILSEGYHERKGGPHAEIQALRALSNSEEAHGATAYVTLEPCCHFGATPPCTQALLSARVARVVIAIGADPDEKVNGGGVDILRAAGVEVVSGVCEAEARESLRAYLHNRRTGRPYVVAKVGSSINGKIAYEDGTSQWITSAASRAQSMRIREESQAILVGVGTVLADNPRLTLRNCQAGDRGILPFTRVVIDPNAKLSRSENSHLNLVSDGQGPTLVFTSVPRATSASVPNQVEFIHLPKIELNAVLMELGRRGIIQVLVEGGATTLGKFFDEQLINELTVFIAPALIGSGGLSFYSPKEPTSIDDIQRRFRLKSVIAVDGGEGDIRIDYTV